jgi:Ca2+-binding RTX toxin-like protein
MTTVTYADGFTPDQLACLLSTLWENGVTVTDQIGDGPDTVTFADEAGNAVILTGELAPDEEGQLQGTLTQIAILQAAVVVATFSDFDSLGAHETISEFAEILDPAGDGPPELHDLLEVLGVDSCEVQGGEDDDEFVGDDGDDDLGGGGGDDDVDGGLGDDHVHGDEGDDTLDGDEGDDDVDGGAGDDDLTGDEGDDELDGGSGDDTADYSSETGTGGVVASLAKHKATDTWGTHDQFKSIENLCGSGNDDTLSGDHKGNVVEGNDGADDIKGLNGDDTLDGGAGDDTLFGGNGKDDISGAEGVDDLTGGNGKDHLDGGTDDDVLKGGNGKDVLNGGEGADDLYGGRGRDTFVFTDPTSGPDTIMDFRSHVDTIAIDFNPDAPEDLTHDDIFFSSDLSELEAGQAALIYDQASGILSYDADGLGGSDAVELAHFKPNTFVGAGDFDFIG